ncbi:glycosyltransferase family 22 protein [Linnemannia elongata AG-77]|uniref:Mannosyltransferase n=1 Tax=Linnemannia elongata AG-77 TaxID=1314771 RepID=A0A197JPW6_9FUNG|nr:glycosyltransferase family 22 protein [Linnemannia elongata AG-77]
MATTEMEEHAALRSETHTASTTTTTTTTTTATTATSDTNCFSNGYTHTNGHAHANGVIKKRKSALSLHNPDEPKTGGTKTVRFDSNLPSSHSSTSSLASYDSGVSVSSSTSFHSSSPSSSSTTVSSADGKTITTITTTSYTKTYVTDETSSKKQPSFQSWTALEFIVQSLVLVLVLAHIVVAPYTKVEESFNLQATHDILNFGITSKGVQQYDHLEFPGVVPRTFVGPLLLAAGSWPLMAIARCFAPDSGLPKGLVGQLIVRSVLGLFTFLGWHQMSRGIRHQFGRTVSILFMVVSASQFHWLFYAGRTLPNTFALSIVNVAYSYWMKASPSSQQTVTRRATERSLLRMIDCLVFATVLFRSEVLILMGPIILLELAMTRLGFWTTVLEGIKAGGASVAIAIAIDSWFWQTWMWAEGAVFWFNAVEGKSVAWGVSPWYTYFLVLLPKIAGLALPLALAGTVVEQRLRRYLLPAGVFVTLYSFLGHKEWRFVIYVVPLLNLGAAITLAWILKRKTIVYKVLAVALLGAVGLNFISSVAQSAISSLNYPGGQALQRLHELDLHRFAAATVHIDGAAAETGCSRFGEIGSSATLPTFSYDAAHNPPFLLHKPWTYSKDETHRHRRDFLHYTHLLTSQPAFHKDDFVTLEQVNGYAGIQRVPLSQIKEACPRAFKELVSAVSIAVSNPKESVASLWTACSPLQVKTEGRIWIMRRVGAMEME